MLRAYATLCLVCAAVFATTPACPDVVTDWNNVVLDIIKADNVNPPRASRAMAMVHTAIYDAVNSIDRTYEPYHVQVIAQPWCSMEAAAASAAHDVLVHLYPAHSQALDTKLAASLAGICDGPAKYCGIAAGRQVAAAIVAWRSTDHSNDIVPYTPGTLPGEWRPTPPGFQPALLPNWPYVTPFAMSSGSQFRIDNPPALESEEYAASLNETKSLGAMDSATRTADQTEIALFWADGGGTVTPPGHWNVIAQDIADQQHNTLPQNARLFALLNVSLADAAIAAWDCKYYFNRWRPITAIREADTDGNPLTEADPTWTPLLVTPPFPECISGHSTFSGAAARMLGLYFGSDDIAFTTGSDSLPRVYRSFDSFSEAALEAGRSRIYGGIHFEFSDTPALAAGNALSGYVWKHYMRRLISIDIKPLAYPNFIDTKSPCAVQVAILGSRSFDVRDIDPATILLAGAPVKTAPGGWLMAVTQDINWDHISDLVVYIDTQLLKLNKSNRTALLEAETYDGTPVVGIDSVRITR